MPEKVIIGRHTNPISHYHTDENCQHIPRRHHKVTRENARARGLEECSTCRGEHPRESNPRISLRSRLESDDYDLSYE
jgi:hypothetical protein